LMSPSNSRKFGTAFTESVDAAVGVTTGISAADRALTIQVCMDEKARAKDLARPGHMFPLMAREGGVLVRSGQTEAAVDLAKLAQLKPGGVICEIMNEDGTMARVPDLEKFCQKHDLLMVTVADLVRYRLKHERVVQRAGEGNIRTEFGTFRTVVYESPFSEEKHMVLAMGDFDEDEETLVRVHAHCVYGNIFGSLDCDDHKLVRSSLKRIAEVGKGALVYLHLSAGGVVVREKQILTHGTDFASFIGRDPQAAQYEYGIGAQIIRDLGLKKLRLMTNRPRKFVALDAFGVSIESFETLSW
jgi:3,4-dihydroxy 2-butanone 4-phosphate synthase / GTP cyclohydrolase II